MGHPTRRDAPCGCPHTPLLQCRGELRSPVFFCLRPFWRTQFAPTFPPQRSIRHGDGTTFDDFLFHRGGYHPPEKHHPHLAARADTICPYATPPFPPQRSIRPGTALCLAAILNFSPISPKTQNCPLSYHSHNWDTGDGSPVPFSSAAKLPLHSNVGTVALDGPFFRSGTIANGRKNGGCYDIGIAERRGRRSLRRCMVIGAADAPAPRQPSNVCHSEWSEAE